MDDETGLNARREDPRGAELIHRWNEHSDIAALDELLRGEISTLRDLIRARGGSMMSGSASASDIAQDAVLKLIQLEVPPKFENAQALRGYLWVTAWRLLLQRIRRPYRRKLSLTGVDTNALPPGVATSPSAAAAAHEAGTAVELAMNLLPQESRDVLDRVYFRGEELVSVAKDLDVSVSAIKMRLLRARRALAERLCAWEKLIG